MRILVIFLFGWLSVSAAQSATLHVPSEYPTIQAAVNAAANGDQVLVATGTYTGPGNTDIFVTGKHLTLESVDGAETTVIDCGGSGRGVYFFDYDQGISELIGFTIRNGEEHAGGGLRIQFAGAVVRDCVFQDNRANYGGAIYLNTVVGVPEFVRCRFEHNVATNEVPLGPDGQNDSTGGETELPETPKGGACFGQYGGFHAQFTDCVFYQNASGAGGALSGDAIGFWVTGSTFAANTAGRGTAIRGDQVILERCLIAFNPGGSAVTCGSSSSATCTNIYGIDGDDWAQCLEGYLGVDGNLSVDPVFCNLEYGELGIAPYSPCAPGFSPCGELIGALPVGSCGQNLPLATEIFLEGEHFQRVADHNPLFRWDYVDLPISSQAAFEVEVGEDNDWSVAEMWAPGPQYTADEFVLYDGADLVDGSQYFLRVRVNNGVTWGDWNSQEFRMNAIPAPPTHVSPAVDEVVHRLEVRLVTTNPVEPDGDALAFEFYLFDDAALSHTVWSVTGLPPTYSNNTSTEIIPGLEAGQSYWWRCRVFDGYEYSEWSAATRLETDVPQVRRVPSEYPTIQAAVDACYTDDQVLIAPGIYGGPGNKNVSVANKAITIMSEGGADVTEIRCGLSGRAFLVIDCDLDRTTIEGLTIVNGTSSAGGSIRAERASIELIGCTIKNSYAPHGGAVYINSAPVDPVFTSCVFYDNGSFGDEQAPGEAVSDTLDVSGADALGMVEGLGGAVYMQYEYFTAHFEDCVFAGNNAVVGAAVAVGNRSAVTMRGCTVVENISDPSGAAIYTGKTDPGVIERCLVAYNLGGSGFVGYSSPYPQIECTNIFGNEGGDWVDELGPQATINNNFSARPEFCDRYARNYSVLSVSPCAAENSPCGALIGALGPEHCADVFPLPLDLHMGAENLERVASDNPEFYWTYIDSPPSSSAGYEIEVGTDADWTVSEMWASGPVYSGAVYATYAGAALGDGETYFVRVRVYNGSFWGSWRGFSFITNSMAEPPLLDAPPDGSLINHLWALLVAESEDDPEGDPLQFEAEIYEDPALTLLNQSLAGQEPEGGIVEFGPLGGLVVGQTYWWRVRSWDGYQNGGWSTVFSFTVRGPGIIRVPLEYPTISGALNMSGPQDTILVDPGEYAEHLTLSDRTVTLMSSGGPEATIISAVSWALPVVEILPDQANQSLIDGFTIKDAIFASGLLINAGNSITVQSCIFFDNFGADGGGIQCWGDGSLIRNCSFLYNTCNKDSHSGAGDPDDPVLDSCTTPGEGCLEPLADEGAGVFIVADDVTVENCFFAHNNAHYGSAGAVYTRFSNNVRVINNVGYQNSSRGQGTGFMYAYRANNVEISGNTLVENQTNQRGGAITLWDVGGADLSKNVLTNNQGGEAIYVVNSHSVTADCILTFENALGDFSGITPGAGCFVADPFFCGYRSGAEDFRVYPESPCMPYNNSCGVQLGALGPSTDCTDYLCGDADGNHTLNWDDVAFLRSAYFHGGELPLPLNAGDPNGDGIIALDDILFLVSYLRGLGPAPVCLYGSMIDAGIDIDPVILPTSGDDIQAPSIEVTPKPAEVESPSRRVIRTDRARAGKRMN